MCCFISLLLLVAACLSGDAHKHTYLLDISVSVCMCVFKVCYTVAYVTESGEWNAECDIVDLLGQQSSSLCG